MTDAVAGETMSLGAPDASSIDAAASASRLRTGGYCAGCGTWDRHGPTCASCGYDFTGDESFGES